MNGGKLKKKKKKYEPETNSTDRVFVILLHKR